MATSTSASTLNREYAPLTNRARAVSAAIAVIATAGIVLSILALAGHYDGQYLRATEAQSVSTANHAKALPAASGTKVSHG